MAEAPAGREPDSGSGDGATEGQAPAGGGAVAGVADVAPRADASDAGGVELPGWTKAPGWCGTAGLIYLLICAVSIISRGFAGMGTDAASLVALTFIGNRAGFRGALGASTIHDFYNWLALLIFFPIELVWHPLERISGTLTNALYGTEWLPN